MLLLDVAAAPLSAAQIKAVMKYLKVTVEQITLLHVYIFLEENTPLRVLALAEEIPSVLENF